MKLWVLAGLFTVVTIPMAAAAEGTVGCDLDDTRQQMRVVSDTEPGSAPAAVQTAQTVARPNVEQRHDEATPEERTAQAQQRRRSGKRVPDAELIGPRGAL